jgi:hypothetical protein
MLNPGPLKSGTPAAPALQENARLKENAAG